MNVKRNLRNLILKGMIGISSLMPIKEAKADLNGNIRYIHPDGYVETNAFYGLPKDVAGFTFMDFHKNRNGYFGKTSLDKAINKGVGPKVQLTHANEPISNIGLGLDAIVPKLPKDTFAKVSFMPLWVDADGKRVKDKVIAGYFGSLDLPKGFKLKSFGEWNLDEENGAKWTYGEIDLGKKIGPTYISYNPALIGNGDAIPGLEHRISVATDF